MSELFAVIIDYGSGNLHSIKKACEKAASRIAGAAVSVVVSPEAEDVSRADYIILPGVGAFGDCVAGLTAAPGMRAALEREALQKKKPFLGVCVGMQMLAERGYENGEHEGLGWLRAEVRPFKPSADAPAPHMGWNAVTPSGAHDAVVPLAGKAEDCYFVHSYHMAEADGAWIQATTDYAGVRFPSVIAKDNIRAMQFHPEKSHETGLRLLHGFFLSGKGGAVC